jgi:hypothetical protein
MDKLCATCGKQLQADQGFCDQCGAAWTPVQEGAAIAAAPTIIPMAAAVPPPAKSSHKTLLLVSIIAIIALVAVGWFFVTHRALAASPDATTAVTSTSASTTVSTAATVVPTTSLVEPAAAPGAATDSTPTPASEAEIAAATTAAASSKQCSLITRAEMETILGAKIVKLTSTEQTCAYFTDAERSAQVEATWSGAKEALAVTKGFNNAEDLFKPIPGIGDEAYFQAGGVLHFLKGTTYVVVNSREYPNELEIESAIAKKIAANLK